MYGRTPKAETIQELKEYIEQAFAEITQETCRRVVTSVPKRLQDCINAEGGHLPY